MTSLWSRAALAWPAAQAVAVAMAVWSFVTARQEARASDQTAWLSLAVLAAVASGLGNGLFLAAWRRAVAQRRRMLLGTDRLHAVPADTGPEALALVAGRGMTRYHRPECVLARGKDVSAVSRAAHERAERLPCDWCQP